MTDETKKKYEPLMKKYSLPKLEELDREFDIGKIEAEDFILKEIRKKIAERFNSFRELLGEILQPEEHIATLHESKYFEEGDRTKIFDVYKKIMLVSREASELSVKNDEKEDAEFIKRIFGKMPSIKAELLPIASKLKRSWEFDEEASEKLGYFG